MVWVLRLGLPLLVVLGGVVYAAHRGAVRLMEPLRWYGEVVVDELSFDLGGTVHAKSITFRPFGTPENSNLTVLDVDIATPGLRWLVSAGVAGDDPSPAEQRRKAAQKGSRGGLTKEPRSLPALDALTVNAGSVEFGSTSWLPPDLRWIGPATGSPFESVGCGSGRRFDAEAFEAMGVPTGPLKGEFRLDAAGDRAKVEVRVFAEGRSSTSWSGDIRLKEPSRFFDTDWQDMALAAEQWFVSDETFVVARNRYCARLVRVTRQGYVEHHANAIAQDLARQGVSVPVALVEVFKRFDARGGELSWHSRPQAPLNRAQFKAWPLEEQVRKIEAQLAVNGENAEPFVLTPLTPEEAESIASSAANGTPVAGAGPDGTPANPTASGAAGASSSQAQQPKPGQDPNQTTTPSTSPPGQQSSASTGVKPTQAPGPSGAAATSLPKPPSPPAVNPGQQAPTGASTTQATPAPPDKSAATAPPAKAPVPVAKVKTKPLPSFGRIRFDDLERAIGRTVRVDTRFGTRRVGRVAAFNRAAVTIEINEKGTSLPLTVPRGTVLTIELVSPESG